MNQQINNRILRPGDTATRSEPKQGDKSICEMCHQPIEFTGLHWRHTTFSPRHPATPAVPS